MPIYKQTTEITNIDDLLSSVERDIEEVYFGDKQVFTVWGEYDGTLPATYSANGSMLADYRVYGTSGGVGDRTENIFDETGAMLIDVTGGGAMRYGKNFGTVPAGTYSITYTRIGDAPNFYVGIKSGSRYANNYVNYRGNKTTVSISEGDELYVWALYPKNDKSFKQLGITDIVLVSSDTVPALYIPYGYKLDMSVSDGTTPIYIGANPLEADEYVDYAEGKIYRMNGGVLTPTDPPVPLPALPTVDGINVVDYAGQSAAVPSRFVAKYRKEGFN